ncbi:MAG: neutral/alkaline non-lysosomal ceramidase N-terminal domain-containing protein [Verrucomicrobia bacterium]|nr:neutral/alkaline non-lysosomal ceramidase N-terminal domain-containing protein [Verrucomicrobiota bacterium]
MKAILSLCLLLCGPLWAADFKAGVARVKITPPLPFWLTGYAARTNPAPTVRSELWAKALALEDDRGGRAVIVTTDLIGLPREVSDVVAERVQQRHGLQRSQLLLNSSHTHSGPVIWPNLRVMFAFDAAETERAAQYARKLADDLAALVSASLSNLAPAQLSCGHATAGFAINRRQPTTNGVRLGLNPGGPVDHDVPVLKVAAPDGSLRAVLFGYACHNTTLGGDFYQVDGDYAGCAQRELEKAHPGATALFLILCGGDQNPSPRGKYENVEQHGQALARAVEGALGEKLKPVRPPIRTSFQRAQLDFAAHTRETFEKELQSNDKFRQRRAQFMLEDYDKGRPIRNLSYPVQAIRLRDDFTILALGGEAVVDLALRAKREYPRENLAVAGYCNEVACYIPSLRVLREGGYEPDISMIYYAQPGPFAESVEENVFRAVHAAMKEAGAER